jgi:hypothetical protein
MHQRYRSMLLEFEDFDPAFEQVMVPKAPKASPNT